MSDKFKGDHRSSWKRPFKNGLHLKMDVINRNLPVVLG